MSTCSGTQDLHDKLVIVKRRKRALYIALALLGVAVTHGIVRERDPLYRGHHFSEWVLHISPSEETATLPFQPKKAQVREAILALGGKNLPLLARWVSFDPGKSLFIPLFRVMPLWFNRLKIFDPVIDSEQHGNDLASNAVDAFKMLGQTAKAAIPRLAQTLRTGTIVPGCRALNALQAIGEPAVPAILSGATRAECISRYHAITSLWEFTNNPEAYRFLTNAIHDPDSNVVSFAVDALKAVEPPY
jgi:hypothetical protein